MPHSSMTDVNGPMDAWDRKRCGVALLEISKHLDLLNWHVGQLRDEESRAEIARSTERVRAAIRDFINESN